MSWLKPNIENLQKKRNVPRLKSILAGRYGSSIRRDAAVALTELGEHIGLDYLKAQLTSGNRFDAELAATGLAQLGALGGHEVLFDFLVGGNSQCDPEIIYSAFVKTSSIHTNTVRRVYSNLMSVLKDHKKAVSHISEALKITLAGNHFEILYERERGHYEDIPCDICRSNDTYPEGSCWGSCECHHTWVLDSAEMIRIIPQE